MNEMGKRVWAGLEGALSEHGDGDIRAGLAWLSDEQKAAIARAAIAAMREPNMRMVAAGQRYEGDVIGPLPESTCGVDSSPEAIAAVQRRLAAVRPMIGAMCSQGRPPTMSVPADRERDEDLLISDTADAAAALLAQVARDRDELQCWQSVAAESNRSVDAWLRSIWPALPEHYGMPLDGIRQVFKVMLDEKLEAHNRAAAAERQLAEARAALEFYAVEWHRNPSPAPDKPSVWPSQSLWSDCGAKARALLSGETT